MGPISFQFSSVYVHRSEANDLDAAACMIMHQDWAKQKSVFPPRPRIPLPWVQDLPSRPASHLTPQKMLSIRFTCDGSFGEGHILLLDPKSFPSLSVQAECQATRGKYSPV